MRVLLTFSGGNGHFQPLVPIGRALQQAGHEVAVTGRPKVLPMIEAAGFTGIASGGDGRSFTEMIPLEPLDMAREERAFRNGFAGWIARERATATLALGHDWRPDVLVCDETDFGPMIAAESLGIPHATVVTLAAGSVVRPDLVAGNLDDIRREHGLEPDPKLEMIGGNPILAPFPQAYRDPAFALPQHTHFFRPRSAVVSKADGPARVYLTLGTIFNMESGDLFHRAIEGASALQVELTVTTGADLDPAVFGPQPASVRLERYVDQPELLPHCQAVISHAGSGSVLGALAHGLPMVLLPMGADQPANAARCLDLGAGIVLDALTASPAEIGAALLEVLGNPSYRDSARAMAASFAALPGPTSVVPLLEELLKESSSE